MANVKSWSHDFLSRKADYDTGEVVLGASSSDVLTHNLGTHNLLLVGHFKVGAGTVYATMPHIHANHGAASDAVFMEYDDTEITVYNRHNATAVTYHIMAWRLAV